jgi:hypothetical protein
MVSWEQRTRVWGRGLARAFHTEKLAEWVTAIATALQTIAVIATLIVAYREWTSHENASKQAKIDNVLKLYSDEPSAVTDSRNFIDEIGLIIFCKVDNLNKGDVSDKLCDPGGKLQTMPARFIEKTSPLLTRVSKVGVCIQAGLCDAT